MNVKQFYTNFTPWKMELFYGLKSLFYHRNYHPFLPPKKILLCNQGALGDVFLTTCMIPSLKKAFPQSSIGILIAPLSQTAVEGCPGIDCIHELNPWFRPFDSKWKKLQRHLQFQAPKYDYDWVICTSPFYQGMGSSLRNIPTRICFATLGDRMYFNHVTPWQSGYIGKQYARILKDLGAGPLQCPWKVSNKTKDYVLFHIGSSDPSKEFSLSFWQDLYDVYQKEGHKVIFTGSGERQEKLIHQIAPPEQNFCNRLTFFEFLQKVAEADHVLSVDTVTIHVAAMLKKRFFAFFQKPSNISLWFPNTKEGALIENCH